MLNFNRHLKPFSSKFSFFKCERHVCLGVHLEGPFISTEKRGAHPIKYIKEMEEGIRTMTKTYGSLENVILMTLAPELKHSSNVIKHLTSDNIKVAIGKQVVMLIDHSNNLVIN